MYRVFLPPQSAADRICCVEPDDAHHLSRVLRMQPGERLWVSDGEGREAIARIARIDKVSVWIEREAWQPGAGEPLLRVVLAQAVPKGDRMDWLIQKATELGVTRIQPLITARSVVRPEAGKGLLRRQRWQRIAREAARQAQRARVPAVDEPLLFSEFLAGQLESNSSACIFILSEGHRETSLAAQLRRIPPPASSAVMLLVGPEGGWEPDEVEAAIAVGAIPAGLGPRTLRAETAGIAGLALVMAHWGDLT